MTLCFPQLSTGALAQWPVRRTLVRRTIQNRLPDGTSIRLADPDAAEIRWELEYQGLSDEERDSLSGFFRQTEGRLASFLLMDPCGNLLAWSDDLSRSAWSVDGLLNVQEADGYLAITNSAQTSRRFQQTVAVPGRFRYCFSAEARATSAGSINVLLSSADGDLASPHAINDSWRTVQCSGDIPGEAEEITCGIEIPAGMTVHLRYLQLQPQPAPSGYRRTTVAGELYPDTRFDTDLLVLRGDGVNNHSTTVRLVSRVRT